MPIPNTPRILSRKKKKCRKIVLYSLLLSLVLFLLFFVSIKLEPRAPTVLTIVFGFSPFLIFFAAILYYYHVKFFPEFDYGDMTEAEIGELAVSPAYRRECSRLRRAKLLKFLLITAFALLGSWLMWFGDELSWIPQVSFALEVISAVIVVLSAGSLAFDVRRRRELEYYRYTLK